MKVYILMFDERVEKVSCDEHKMRRLADESNGITETGEVLAGPYFVVKMELEDYDLIKSQNRDRIFAYGCTKCCKTFERPFGYYDSNETISNPVGGTLQDKFVHCPFCENKLKMIE